MDIKQLEAFCMVVRQGSFSKAARVLGVSQPTVSAHISTLEKELGCELLIRTSKSILPTDKGATLLGYAQGIMSLRQKALEELSREDSRYTGSITIAASSVPAQYCLPELLSEFSREYPGVSYQLHNTNSLQAVEEVRRGKADIALTGARVENTNCEFTSFLKDELVIITANSEHFRGFNGNFPRELLKKEPFIARELGSGTRMEYEQLLRSEGICLRESVVKGSLDRLNPILMTALSSALALIPLAVTGDLPGNEIQSPMAKVILGGLLTSTLLNGFIIPIVYLMMNERAEQKQGRE